MNEYRLKLNVKFAYWQSIYSRSLKDESINIQPLDHLNNSRLISLTLEYLDTTAIDILYTSIAYILNLILYSPLKTKTKLLYYLLFVKLTNELKHDFAKILFFSKVIINIHLDK